LNGNATVKFLAGGYCIVNITAQESPLILSATKQFSIKVSKLQNEITSEFPYSLFAGNPIISKPNLKFKADFSVNVKDNFYCSITGDFLVGSNEGNCSIVIKVFETEKYLGFTKTLDIVIEKKEQRIKLNQLSFFFENSKGPIDLQASSNSGLPLFLRSLTSTVCTSQGNKIIGLRTGECRLSVEQAGNNEYRAAQSVFINGQVFMDKITISCVKGKTTKKVTAIKPVCPKGYKKKT
jgi:hypothetical protein